MTLEYLSERMPDDMFAGWAAYILEWHDPKRIAERKFAAEHSSVMKKAARAAGRR